MKLTSLLIILLLGAPGVFWFVRPATSTSTGQKFELAKSSNRKPAPKKPRKSRKKSAQNG